MLIRTEKLDGSSVQIDRSADSHIAWLNTDGQGGLSLSSSFSSSSSNQAKTEDEDENEDEDDLKRPQSKEILSRKHGCPRSVFRANSIASESETPTLAV